MPEIPFDVQFPTVSSFFEQTGGFPEDGWVEFDLDDDSYDDLDLNEIPAWQDAHPFPDPSRASSDDVAGLQVYDHEVD